MNLLVALVIIGIVYLAVFSKSPPALPSARSRPTNVKNNAKNNAKKNARNNAKNNAKNNSKNKGGVKSEFQGLPYPQISRDIQRLSTGDAPSPSNTNTEIPPSPPFVQVRTEDTPDTMSPIQAYIPNYYRKDTMPANNIGTTEYKAAYVDGNNSPWSDTTFSEHPSFYNPNNRRDELTNIGAFFDSNNQYHDTTSHTSFALPSDTCYTDSEGGETCINNSRTQMIPPSLIREPKTNQALRSLGTYQTHKMMKTPANDRVSCGGMFYGTVIASSPLGTNETYAPPLGSQTRDALDTVHD